MEIVKELDDYMKELQDIAENSNQVEVQEVAQVSQQRSQSAQVSQKRSQADQVSQKRSQVEHKQEEEEELEGIEDGEDKESSGVKYKPPKGSTDYDPQDMVIRDKMMNDIKECLRRCGCAQLETPVFELIETLCGSYGEDEKLIFELKDQGGEQLALRYDHTVPLARYIAKNRKNFKTTLRAARIGRVYRRDQPNKKKGRMREFYQCDLDIVRFGVPANSMELVIDDAEILNMVCSVLTTLIGRDAYNVKVNNRKIFDCVLTLFNVSEDQFRAIGSAVDKLDKNPWEEVKQEMIEKGITGEQAEGIYRYLGIKGNFESVKATFENDAEMMGVQGFPEALAELEQLFMIVESYGWRDKVLFDMSMVRGLAYYTGMILEGELVDDNGIGSISGGGRYNNLVNRFAPGDFPCTGASIGFERIFSYLKMQQQKAGVALKQTCTQVLVAEVSNKDSTMDLFPERVRLLQELRSAGIAAEMLPRFRPGFREQIEYCESWQIPFMCIIGASEIEGNTVNVTRKVFNGDTVLMKSKKAMQRGVLSGKDGKFYLVKNDHGKEEKRKINSVQVYVSPTGFECPIKSTQNRDELVGFLRNAL